MGRLIFEQGPLLLLIKRYRIDVLFCPANISPLFTGIPCVITVQNMAPWYGEHRFGDFASRLRFGVLGALTAWSARRAARMIFLSQFARETLVRRYHFEPAAKQCVIYRARGDARGSDQETNLLNKLGLTQPYILTISNLHRYKHIEPLIEAYARVLSRRGNSGPQLVIAGAASSPAYRESLERLAEKSCGPHRVVFAGAVRPADIGVLLRSCLCFVFTSGCENCPNALIEALSYGAAIGCSHSGVMPEIAGEAALYFDPRNPAEIESALNRLITEPETRRSLQREAVKRSLIFPTAFEVSSRTLEVIERAGAAIEMDGQACV
jgi:glycosyltransferase involved in cell wall biosynthesis